MNQKDHLIYELKKIITEEIERIKSNIANGSAQNFDDYKRQVGVIQGLLFAAEQIGEANSIVVNGKARGE